MSEDKDLTGLVTYVDTVTPTRSPFSGFHQFVTKGTTPEEMIADKVVQIDTITRLTHSDGRISYRGYSSNINSDKEHTFERNVLSGGPAYDLQFNRYNDAFNGLISDDTDLFETLLIKDL